MLKRISRYPICPLLLFIACSLAPGVSGHAASVSSSISSSFSRPLSETASVPCPAPGDGSVADLYRDGVGILSMTDCIDRRSGGDVSGCPPSRCGNLTYQLAHSGDGEECEGWSTVAGPASGRASGDSLSREDQAAIFGLCPRTRSPESCNFDRAPISESSARQLKARAQRNMEKVIAQLGRPDPSNREFQAAADLLKRSNAILQNSTSDPQRLSSVPAIQGSLENGCNELSREAAANNGQLPLVKALIWINRCI